MSKKIRKFGPNPLREKPWWQSQSYLGAAALLLLALLRPLAERYGLRLPEDVWNSLFWGALSLMGIGIRNAQARQADAAVYGQDWNAPADAVPRYHPNLPSQPGDEVKLDPSVRMLSRVPGRSVAYQNRRLMATDVEDVRLADERDPYMTIVDEGPTLRD